MYNPLILMVEDNEMFAYPLVKILERAGFEVVHKTNPEDALAWLQTQRPDAIILDIDFKAARDGYDLCRLIREGGWTGKYFLQAEDVGYIPILMLTEFNKAADQLKGFDVGTTDYVPKDDWDPEVLIARLRGLLRRPDVPKHGERIIRFGSTWVDLKQQQMYAGEHKLKLTEIEYALLAWFAQHPGEIQSRKTLLEKVWDIIHPTQTRAVDACITRVRAKLAEAKSTCKIETEHGQGYQFIPQN